MDLKNTISVPKNFKEKAPILAGNNGKKGSEKERRFYLGACLCCPAPETAGMLSL